jgi:hypothetical protein
VPAATVMFWTKVRLVMENLAGFIHEIKSLYKCVPFTRRLLSTHSVKKK